MGRLSVGTDSVAATSTSANRARASDASRTVVRMRRGARGVLQELAERAASIFRQSLHSQLHLPQQRLLPADTDSAHLEGPLAVGLSYSTERSSLETVPTAMCLSSGALSGEERKTDVHRASVIKSWNSQLIRIT